MRFSLFISILIILSSCGRNQTSDFNSPGPDTSAVAFKWIEGKYVVMNDQSGFYYEEWFKADADNYNGTGCFLTRDCVDTIFSIKMRLIHEKEKTILFYDVKDQKENKETEFTLTKGENNIYVFENPFRDFPSIMQYKIIGDSVIEVIERGFANNKEKVVEYRAPKIN